MRAYVDTSVVVAAHTREPLTDLAQNWLSTQSGEGLILSSWVLVECESALAIKVRRGELDRARQGLAIADIDAFAARFAPRAELSDEDFQHARVLCRDAASRLRAGDALHLALALRLGAERFATLDRVLSNNAEAQGLALCIALPQPRSE